jgi:aldose 1-epimerase
MFKHFIILLTLMLPNSLKLNAQNSIEKKLWGKSDGKDVWLYKLTNAGGMSVEITNYGGIVVSIYTPNREHKIENIVLGFGNLHQYRKQNSPYMGAIIGRFANRIAGSTFVIDKIKYLLFPNDKPNHSHGGKKGFNQVVWNACEIKESGYSGVELEYLSKDMEEGYPGNLNVKVTYILTDDSKLKIYYEAKTDKPTIVNLTHHSYFNLSGNRNDILDHDLTIFADAYTPTDQSWIPTGVIAPVSRTPFDFTSAHKVGERISRLTNGYNINYVLRRQNENALAKAAEVFDSNSGRMMTVFTTEPGLQLYTADYLNGSIIGRGNIVLSKNMGLCLEAQHFPDSPNKPDFPSTILRAGETYKQFTVYEFSTK